MNSSRACGMLMNLAQISVCSTLTWLQATSFQCLCQWPAQELEKKMEFIHQFKQHMEDIQRERSLQELLESENLETGGRPILFVQTDGMDQAKWALPRWGTDRPGKHASGIVRL